MFSELLLVRNEEERCLPYPNSCTGRNTDLTNALFPNSVTIGETNPRLRVSFSYWEKNSHFKYHVPFQEISLALEAVTWGELLTRISGFTELKSAQKWLPAPDFFSRKTW